VGVTSESGGVFGWETFSGGVLGSEVSTSDGFGSKTEPQLVRTCMSIIKKNRATKNLPLMGGFKLTSQLIGSKGLV
jgi:hypothetical protein